MDDLEQRLDAALTALPPGVDAGQPPPLVRSPEPARPPEPPMPLVNTLERAEAAKARARIEAKRDELRLLDRVVGEVRNIDRRKAEIRHRLEHLEGLKR